MSQDRNQLPRLVVILRSSREQWRLSFDRSPITIGRSEHCDLHLPFPWISLQHAELRWSEEGIGARDLLAKSPARIHGERLTERLTPPSQQLTLSLPTLSLECSISYTEKVSDRADLSYITRELWRPESGWILWALESEEQLSLMSLMSPSNENTNHMSPSEPIASYPWRSARHEHSSINHIPICGHYWILGERGHFELSHPTLSNKQLVTIDRQGPLINGEPLVSGQDSFTWSKGSLKLALNREASPPIDALSSAMKRDRPWWFRMWTR